MSAITVGGDLVHYEVLGRGGRPVILIHGWIGSWRYWIPTMRQLQLKFRVYALDLFGYGDSGKNPARYSIDQQVLLLDEFMKQLGIPKAAILAHGLGAQVSIHFARQYADRVARMLLTSAPLFDLGDLDTRVPPGKRVLLTGTGSSTPQPAGDQSAQANQGQGASASPDVPGDRTPPANSDATIPRRPADLDIHISRQADQTVPSTTRETIRNPNMIDREMLRRAALAREQATGSILPDDEDDQVTQPMRAMPAAPPDTSETQPTDVTNPLKNVLTGNMETLLARCFKRSEPEFIKLQSDISKTDESVLTYAVDSFSAGAMLDSIRQLEMPVVMAHGEDDPLIPVPSEAIWNYLTDQRDEMLLPVQFSGTRHFPMLESDTFQRLVGLFLETPEISKIELRERWRRRSR
ncbi:MAG: alpha/beta fold hydrolase [Chloroflexota bacterium]